MKFNFDEWAQLAKQDRAAFEEKRITTLKQEIKDFAGNDDKLRMLNGLQFKIDMVRRKQKTPLAACMVISEMMMKQVYLLAHLDVDEIIRDSKKVPDQHADSCKVIQLNIPRK